MRNGVDRLILAALIVSMASQTTAQRQSLIVAARANGGTANVDIEVNGPIGTVESMIEPSSLIVRAVVLSATTKLSPDETDVVTEYELVPSRFYKGSLPLHSRPGVQRPLRFTIPYGTVDIDGLHLGTSVNIFPAAEMPRPGEDIIVFLYESQDWRTYALCCGAFAAFRVIDGQVVGLTEVARERRGDTPQTLGQFEQRVSEALSKYRR